MLRDALYFKTESAVKMKYVRTLQCLASCAAFLMSAAPPAIAQSASPVDLDLVSEVNAIRAGQAIWVGLKFTVQKDWHIYWQNPGDSGQPPRAQWELPAGFRVGELQWPVPVRLGAGSVVDFGYDRDAMLLVRITPPATLPPGSSVTLSANVAWLMCRDICIPGKKRVALSLPVKVASERNVSHEALFTQARASLPLPIPRAWRATLAEDEDQFVLTVRTAKRETSAYFFPLDPGQIDHSAPQVLKPMAEGFRLSMRKSDQLLHRPKALRGVLVLRGGSGYSIQVALPPKNEPSREEVGMTRRFVNVAVILVVPFLAWSLAWAAKVGEPAPDFTATDSNAKTHRLADYKGKVVVLEWHNQGCPYVKKHYDSGNMPRLQKEWTSRGVIWLTVISSAPGKQGYVTPAQANEYVLKTNAAPTATLLDPEGT